MWVRGVSRAFSTFLPPFFFFFFSLVETLASRVALHGRKGRLARKRFVHLRVFALPFVHSFVRSNRGPITRSEPDSRSRFLDFVARNTIHRSTFPRSLSPSVLESTLPLGSTPRFTVARRDTRSSGIQRWTKTTESRSKEVKKRARMDNGLARSVTRKSR